MAHAAPGHVRDMEQPVDAAEVDKGSVIGDIFHHALNQLAFLQRRQRRLAVRRSRVSSKQHTAGHDDVAPPMIDLDDLERERLARPTRPDPAQDADRSASQAKMP